MPGLFSYVRLLVLGALLCAGAAAHATPRAYEQNAGPIIPINSDSAAASSPQVSTLFQQSMKLAARPSTRVQRVELVDMLAVGPVLILTEPIAATATTGAQPDDRAQGHVGRASHAGHQDDSGEGHSSHADSDGNFDPAEPPDDDSSPTGELVHCSSLSAGFDDVGDLLAHLRTELYIGSLAAGQRAHQRLIEQRVRTRLEDRRFEKPPRV
jgi:hypothetical protein